ncbi:unnamed protein product [Dovyalis caffra]|uniref:Uncharacterized protein n=1 Tax=Dovyalis caffra TaxID=77055 RepID=A0AAV1S9H8_9ROSI|nr:unnamed protein product [Dovyalis caffra]
MVEEDLYRDALNASTVMLDADKCPLAQVETFGVLLDLTGFLQEQLRGLPICVAKATHASQQGEGGTSVKMMD